MDAKVGQPVLPSLVRVRPVRVEWECGVMWNEYAGLNIEELKDKRKNAAGHYTIKYGRKMCVPKLKKLLITYVC